MTDSPDTPNPFVAPAFKRWYDLAAADPLHVDLAYINEEARKNMWRFVPVDQEKIATPALTSAGLQSMLMALVQDRQAQINGKALPPMVFYCWYDGYICFSLVSASWGRLPFTCKLRLVPALRTITDFAVDVAWLNPESDPARPQSDEESASAESQEFVLPVWRTHLSRSPKN